MDIQIKKLIVGPVRTNCYVVYGKEANNAVVVDPGDEIIGYITRGRGISIHRTDCLNILSMSEEERGRLAEAEWQKQPDKKSEKYMAEITIYANNRTGIIADLSKITTEREIDVTNMNVRTNKQGLATISMSFEVSSTAEQNKLIEKMRNVESIIDIERL